MVPPFGPHGAIWSPPFGPHVALHPVGLALPSTWRVQADGQLVRGLAESTWKRSLGIMCGQGGVGWERHPLGVEPTGFVKL